MSDGIQLIHSDDYGNPDPRSGLLHWVRVTSNPQPSLVNQLTSGGAFPHADCGEADILSSLHDRGKTASVVTIEHDASAGSKGTSAAQLCAALAHFGIASTYHVGTLGPGYVMNPLGGRLIASVDYGQYAAASAREFVAISTTGPWDNDDMSALSEEQIADIHTAIFGPVAQDGGQPSYPAKPNNLDIVRRKLAGYSQGYPAADGAEITFTNIGGAALTAAETAQLAQIPAILAILTRIETALHAA